MNDFETLLKPCQGALERYVRFRISPKADADDVLQEILLSAYRAFPTLRNPATFKGWILRIAQSKCMDFFVRAPNVWKFRWKRSMNLPSP